MSMTDEETLLVMTIVRLIKGETPDAKKVQSAYDNAVKVLAQRDRGPQNVR